MTEQIERIEVGTYIATIFQVGSKFEIQVTPAPRTHPDIFTNEEAQAYLKLTKGSFDLLRREHGIRGKMLGGRSLYSREQLDALRKKIWGMDWPPPKNRK